MSRIFWMLAADVVDPGQVITSPDVLPIVVGTVLVAAALLFLIARKRR